MYGAPGVANPSGPAIGRQLAAVPSAFTLASLSSFHTPSCMKISTGPVFYPSSISSICDLSESRSQQDITEPCSVRQRLRLQASCTLLSGQSSLLGCASPRSYSFFPSLVATRLPRRSLGQNLRSVKEPSVTEPTSDERSDERPDVLRRVINADADQLGGEHISKLHEVEQTKDDSSSASLKAPSLPATQKGQLKNRIVFGFLIGLGCLGVVLAGGWVFTLAVAATVWVATGEYFDLVQSKGMTRGMEAPPLVATKICSAICAAMPLMTLYFGGRVGVAVTTSSFLLATVLLLQRGPRFSQLSSAIFGLFYCGYLPCFWIKLRCGLAVPAINTKGVKLWSSILNCRLGWFWEEFAAIWPVLLGGQALWTVGLVATIISMSTVIAADTGAFVGGRALGRTPLSEVSPKKTLEGAAVGLCSSVGVAVLLARLLQWPTSIPSAAAMAILVFMGSLFGDLTESMIKRDAGVKDSGKLIPGHGGILDRVDSYIFTGALVYSFVKIGVPLFGV